jgi:hypothetical protein
MAGITIKGSVIKRPEQKQKKKRNLSIKFRSQIENQARDYRLLVV